MATEYGPAKVMLVTPKTSILIHNQGEASTVANPWRRSRQGCSGPLSRTGWGTPDLSNGASSSEDNTKEPPLTAKAAAGPISATRAAPTASPATRPKFKLMLVSELALGKSSSGTIWGNNAA